MLITPSVSCKCRCHPDAASGHIEACLRNCHAETIALRGNGAVDSERALKTAAVPPESERMQGRDVL